MTLVRNICRRGRIEALLSDGRFGDNDTQAFANILQPSAVESTAILNPVQLSNALKGGTTLDITHYHLLLTYLNTHGRQYVSAYSEGPFALTSPVLPPVAQHCHHYKIDERTYSCYTRHIGNSQIQFYTPVNRNQQDTGRIEAIWELVLDGRKQQFLLVRKHQPLNAIEEQRSPYATEACSHLKSKIAHTQASEELQVIEPQHIICHLTSFTRPPGTFGFNFETMVVCWALNRGRQ